MKRILSLRHSFTRHLAILLTFVTLLSSGPLFAQSGDDLFRRADSLYVAGIELYNAGDFLEAAALFEECDSLNMAGGREGPYYSANAMRWEGSSYYKVGDTVRTMRADSLYYMLTPVDQRLTVRSDSLSNLATCYLGVGNYEKASEEKHLAKNVYAENLRNNFSFLTANARSMYWDRIKEMIGSSTIYCVIYPSNKSNELAYDVELLSKGILLSSELEFDKVIRSSGDASRLSGPEAKVCRA